MALLCASVFSKREPSGKVKKAVEQSLVNLPYLEGAEAWFEQILHATEEHGGGEERRGGLRRAPAGAS